MNLLELWHRLFEKRGRKKPKYVVFTEPGTPEEILMHEWLTRWEKHCSYLQNTGCGCEECGDIFEFDAPTEAMAELPDEMVESYEELHRPPRTGTPSSFREFNRIAAEIEARARENM